MNTFHPDMFVEALKLQLQKIIASEKLGPDLKQHLLKQTTSNIKHWEEKIKAELLEEAKK